LKNDVLPKVLQRHFPPQPGLEVPNLVGPFLKFGVVRGPAFESDGLILCAARRFAAAAGIASLPVLDNLGRALERAAFADTSHILAIPFQTEFEIFVGIESL